MEECKLTTAESLFEEFNRIIDANNFRNYIELVAVVESLFHLASAHTRRPPSADQLNPYTPPHHQLFYECIEKKQGSVRPHQEYNAFLQSHGPDVKEIFLPSALSDITMEEHPNASNFRCLYCGDGVDGEPWCVYDKRLDTGGWRVFHNFCSVGCAGRYLSTVHMPGKVEEWKVNLSLVARERLNLPITEPIPLAPPIEARVDYGGSISVEAWKEMAGCGLCASTAQTNSLQPTPSVKTAFFCRGPFVYGTSAACITDVTGSNRIYDTKSTLEWITQYSDKNKATAIEHIDPTPELGRYGTRKVPTKLQSSVLCNASNDAVYVPHVTSSVQSKIPTSELVFVQEGEAVLNDVFMESGAEIAKAARKVNGTRKRTKTKRKSGTENIANLFHARK